MKCTKEVLLLVLTEGRGGWNWAKKYFLVRGCTVHCIYK